MFKVPSILSMLTASQVPLQVRLLNPQGGQALSFLVQGLGPVLMEVQVVETMIPVRTLQDLASTVYQRVQSSLLP